MDPSVLAALERQAEAAEARLDQIESKLAAGGSGALPAAAVADLQELKGLLLQAKADNEALAAERDQAVKAARAAEAEVSKLNYRVLHLARSLRAADGRGGAAAPSS